MVGIDREYQAIEKAPALGRCAGKQRIHRRNEPDHAQVIGEGCGRADRLAVNPALALDHDAVLGRPFDAGTERRQAQRALDLGGDRPRAVALAECDFLERGAAQTAAGREEGNGLDQIGFAGAIGTDQHDGLRADLERRRVVVAEISQREPANCHYPSSSAKADDPVIVECAVTTDAGAYWMLRRSLSSGRPKAALKPSPLAKRGWARQTLIGIST